MLKLTFNNCFKFIPKFVFCITIFLIFAFGIFIRCKLYFASIPFWFDEVNYSINIIDKKLIDMFLPFEHFQKAPPLFNSLVWIITKINGGGNWYINPIKLWRFIPFISSIISVFAFFILLKNICKSKISVILGMFLITCNVPLIYYSNEFRAYSSDVLICILLLIAYKYIHLKDINYKQVVIYSFITICLVLFSFPTIFIIPALVFAKSIEEKCFNLKSGYILLSVVLPALFVWLSDFKNFQFMEFFWKDCERGFLDFYSFCHLLFINSRFISGIIEPNNLNACFDNHFYFCIPCILGLIVLFIKNKSFAIFLLFILLITVLSSVFHIYPLSNRHILFLIPVLILAISKLSDMSKNEIINFFIAALISLFLYFVALFKIPYVSMPINSLIDLKYNIHDGQEVSKVKEITTYFFDNYKAGDKVLIYGVMSNWLKYYNFILKKNIDFKSDNVYDCIHIGCYEQIIIEINDFFNKHYNKDSFWILSYSKDCIYNSKIDVESYFDDLFKRLNINYKKKKNYYFFSIFVEKQ